MYFTWTISNSIDFASIAPFLVHRSLTPKLLAFLVQALSRVSCRLLLIHQSLLSKGYQLPHQVTLHRGELPVLYAHCPNIRVHDSAQTSTFAAGTTTPDKVELGIIVTAHGVSQMLENSSLLPY